MINIRQKLLRAIARSQQAYELYSLGRSYYEAMRIYNANKVVYELLQDYLYDCGNDEVVMVNNYIFHLDDWFNQFDCEKMKIINMTDNFVFLRYERSVSFPHKFVTYLKSLE